MDQSQFRTGIVDDMGQQVASIGDIDGHADGADVAECEIGLETFPAVRQPDDDMIAIGYALRLKRGTETACAVPCFRICPALTVLEDREDLIRLFGRPAVEHVTQDAFVTRWN